MADNTNPLGPDHLAQINDALQQADVAEQQLNLAERAGIDVSQQRASLADSVKRLRAIKQVYFPAHG